MAWDLIKQDIPTLGEKDRTGRGEMGDRLRTVTTEAAAISVGVSQFSLEKAEVVVSGGDPHKASKLKSC